ncbi:MAG: DegQ family serine endoprotease [Nitrospirota bacterium]|nr:DegQ family serine endoprotease [Nitrospirota bacterium]
MPGKKMTYLLWGSGLLIVGAFVGLVLSSGLKIELTLHPSKVDAESQPSVPVIAPTSFAGVVKQVYPAVVNINTTTTVKAPSYPMPFSGPSGSPFDDFFERFFGQMPKEFKQRSLGSGVVISGDGFILTNSHVVEKADQVRVSILGGQTFDAEVVGKDKSTDVALIRIKADKPLPSAALGDSDKLEVGEWVLAMGNPVGLDHTVTAGIISAKGRSLGLGGLEDFLQTDASINPGNSGGPLVNLQGKVVGINTAILANAQGIGFAIPVNIVRTFLPQLKTKGRIDRGWLGVSIQEITPEIRDAMGLGQAQGALVADVIKGGPADRAGIQRGDIVAEFNGKPIDRYSKLPLIVSSVPPGSIARVKIIRNGKAHLLQVKVGTFPDEDETASGDNGGTKERSSSVMGMTLKPLTPEFARRQGIEADKGLIVLEVTPGSEADFIGIAPGDVILEVDKRPLNTVESLKSILKSKRSGESILLLIKRQDSTLYLSLRMR